ncbi:hypothetical protein [Roseicella aerolata]|uniref:Transmembrane protein n=1 Tax=Roseicella aerolata TaxID=2883479 RepID=A0A9X1L8U6_9PROT|nr:hypothetical protein [Roseicella aerolata]MCB4820298.1 hypothetical protein [Roseicella aerolata]
MSASAGEDPRAAHARRRVLWMNLLFAAGLALALPWFAAGLLAHWWGPARGTLWATHHAYAVRTFWFGFIGLLAPILAPGVGLAMLGLVWLWCAARMVRAWLAWEREEWIIDPGRFV